MLGWLAVSAGSWEVIIIGGGPAGLSAALTLGRCRRRVLLCDVGQPRNRHARAMHTYLSRDGLPPQALRTIGHEQLAPYTSVESREALAVDATRCEEGFEVTMLGGARERSRKLLLATGVVDHLPDVRGIERFYGASVHHCPYCDGWEWRDQPLAAYGRGARGAGLALMLKQWSADVMLFTDGPGELSAEHIQRLAREHIEVYEQRIAQLEGRCEGEAEGGRLERIVLQGGVQVARRALFFNTGQHQRSALASRLGCQLTQKGAVAVEEYHVTTCVPGLYVAGDASRDVQFVIVAAAEGAKAAFAINRALLAEEGRA